MDFEMEQVFQVLLNGDDLEQTGALAAVINTSRSLSGLDSSRARDPNTRTFPAPYCAATRRISSRL
jgi:hypothetical protein